MGLAEMLSGLGDSIGGLFSGGSGVASNLPTFTTNAGLQSTIGSQAGDMTQLLGRGVDGGLAGGLAGILGDIDLMDLGKLGLGAYGMKEQSKTNKKNNTLLDQNITENDRIALGRTDLEKKFNTGLAATRTS